MKTSVTSQQIGPQTTIEKGSRSLHRAVSWTGAVLLVAAITGPLHGASLVMELETTDYGGEEPRVSSSQMAIDGQRLKMDLGRSDDGGLNHTMVFHGGEKPRIEIFNHRDKSFLVMDPESIKALGEEMQAAMAQARDQIAALPPEQQAVVRKLLDAQLQQAKKPELPPSTVMQTSERQERQGLPCRKYDVFRDGDKIREVWVTPWGEVRGSREALAVLRDMSDFYSELMESFEKQASANFGGGFALDNHPFADLQHMEGFPVVTRNYADGSLKTEIVVKSIENQIFEPEAFLPPAGYRPTTMGPR